MSMTKEKQKQAAVLGALVVVLIGVWFFNRSSGPSLVGVVADEHFQPLKIEDPSLRLDLLEKIRNTQYTGSHRNIFTGEAPPPPPSVLKKMKEEEAKRLATPPPPPPVTVPAKFFGYAMDPRTGERRAFFVNTNQDVFIVGQGGILLNNFRILKINNNSVEVEEISSGRRTTLNLEPGAGPAGFAGGNRGFAQESEQPISQ